MQNMLTVQTRQRSVVVDHERTYRKEVCLLSYGVGKQAVTMEDSIDVVHFFTSWKSNPDGPQPMEGLPAFVPRPAGDIYPFFEWDEIDMREQMAMICKRMVATSENPVARICNRFHDANTELVLSRSLADDLANCTLVDVIRGLDMSSCYTEGSVIVRGLLRDVEHRAALARDRARQLQIPRRINGIPQRPDWYQGLMCNPQEADFIDGLLTTPSVDAKAAIETADSLTRHPQYARVYADIRGIRVAAPGSISNAIVVEQSVNVGPRQVDGKPEYRTKFIRIRGV